MHWYAQTVATYIISIIFQELCTSSNKPASKDPSERRDLYTRAKDALTNESRQFVTASKLFVKSATESEGQLLECLSHCVAMIERIGALTRDVALLTPTPLQTQVYFQLYQLKQEELVELEGQFCQATMFFSDFACQSTRCGQHVPRDGSGSGACRQLPGHE